MDGKFICRAKQKTETAWNESKESLAAEFCLIHTKFLISIISVLSPFVKAKFATARR
jgi:hypothetical protein